MALPSTLWNLKLSNEKAQLGIQLQIQKVSTEDMKSIMLSWNISGDSKVPWTGLAGSHVHIHIKIGIFENILGS